LAESYIGLLDIHFNDFSPIICDQKVFLLLSSKDQLVLRRRRLIYDQLEVRSEAKSYDI